MPERVAPITLDPEWADSVMLTGLNACYVLLLVFGVTVQLEPNLILSLFSKCSIIISTVVN